MNFSFLPKSFYNCSPEECTPVTPEDIYLRNWQSAYGFAGGYPVTVIAQELSFEPMGHGCLRGVFGETLARSEPCANEAETRAVMLDFFRKYRRHHRRVHIGCVVGGDR